MRSPVGSTGGSAFHPVAAPSGNGALPQRAVSADVDPKINMPRLRGNVNAGSDLSAIPGGMRR